MTKIKDLSDRQLLEFFKDAIRDENYNPTSEDYNKSGFTCDELESEVLSRMYNMEDYE